MGQEAFSAVVLGASAGGMEALTAVLSRLPKDFPLPVLVVQHLHAADGGRFAEHLNGGTALPVEEACDKAPICAGRVYLAPANYHLLVEHEDAMALSVDKEVCGARPSIDVLFESAARVWGRGLIGVILSGVNADGAAGMCRIIEAGGLAVAQDPRTASSPQMPEAAIWAARIETILPPDAIGDFLCCPRRTLHPANGAADLRAALAQP